MNISTITRKITTAVLTAAALLLAGSAIKAGAAAQTNVFTSSTTTSPYFSTSAMAQINSGIVVANEPIAANSTNTYTWGTNYLTGTATVFPFSFPTSELVAFSLGVLGTNATSAGTVTAYFDLGTGYGDWIAGGSLSATVAGTTNYFQSGVTNTYAYPFARLNRVSNTSSTYNSLFSFGFASKKGF